MAPQDHLLVPGTVFEGRYEIVAKIGHGGFGAVYKVRQLSTRQLVALKVMHVPDHAGTAQMSTRVARFLREAQLCVQLHHPNIVQVIDSGKTDTSLYTVFAFAPGDNLADVLAREGALKPGEAKNLMMQVLDALTCAHAQGIVHRDLKPSNIMVIPTGARRNALILDFGIGTIVEGALGEPSPRITGTNDTLGTPGYGAPEQWRGLEASPTADLFSWGIVCLECLTGKPVYGGKSSAEIFYQQLGPEPVPIPAALRNHPLGDIIIRATRKEVEARDVSARILFDALEACDVSNLFSESLLGIAGRTGHVVDANASTLHSTLAAGPNTQRKGAMSQSLPEEKRQLIALCCRLVAFTTMSKTLELEELDEILRESLVICAEIASQHGGRVAAALGDELLVYFGYPRAEETDAERAGRAALAIADAIAKEGDRLAPSGFRAEVSISIHVGFVFTGDLRGMTGAGLVVGATARLASRLASLSPPGFIMVTGESYRFLRNSFDAEPLGTRAIDGIPKPIEVLRLQRERAAHTRGATSEPATATMVGRDHELELLLERWQRVRAGHGQCCLITGEPGIGKSRLTRELRNRLAAEDYAFLDGRCSPDTRNAALFPIVDMLHRVLGLDRNDDPRNVVARLETALMDYGFPLADVMPLFTSLFALPACEPYVPLDVSPQRQKDLTLSAILSLLLAKAEKMPLLVLVEDLHWSDPTTIELLTRLVREAPSNAMCILLTARPEFSPTFATTGMLQFPLSRLERAQIELLVSELLGGIPLQAAALDRVASRTDGIPLFIEELTRMMLESGVLVEKENRYEISSSLADIEMPGTLRALLTVRLDRMERAKETAQLAAALGREFSVEVLVAASPLDPLAVQDDLEKLMTAGLVLRKRRLKDSIGLFKHALVRDAAYESLSKVARLKVHARIAITLEERFPELVQARPDLLAYHYAAAELREPAIAYAQRAADQALERSAYAEATAHASNAIEWSASLSGRPATLANLKANGTLAQALMATRGWGDADVSKAIDRSQNLVEQLNDLEDLELILPTLYHAFLYHHVASNRREGHELAERFLRLVEKSEDRGLLAAGNTLLGLALHAEGKFTEAAHALEKAVELYDAHAHAHHANVFGLDTYVWASATLGLVRWFSVGASAALASAEAALQRARELKHLPSIGIALLYEAIIHQYSRDKSSARSVTDELLSLAAKHGLPAYEGYAAVIRGWACGSSTPAREILAALPRMGCRLALSYYGALVADIDAAQGNLEMALTQIDECLVLCETNGDCALEPELYRWRAEYLCSCTPARTSEARRSLELAIALSSARGLTRTAALASEKMLQLGDAVARPFLPEATLLRSEPAP